MKLAATSQWWLLPIERKELKAEDMVRTRPLLDPDEPSLAGLRNF